MVSLVTVFGGSGFLGRHAVRALAKAGYRIRVGVRHPNCANYLLPMGSVGQIQVVKVHADDPEEVAAAVKGADAVVNLVGILYPGGHQTFESVHVDAAQTIAKAAKAAGAQSFVQVSSAGASEDWDSEYARTKAVGEARVREAFPEAAILRPTVVFGPEDNFFNRFASMARMPFFLLPALPLIGGGNTRFQPVYVGDVAAAIAECIRNPATHGRTYELGGPGTYSFRELMEIILRETCRKKPLVSIPFSLAMLQATFLGLLPKPMLTRDQVKLLRHDNVVSPDALTLADLGIVPESLEAVVPSYLWRYRPEGQFEEQVREKVGATSTI